MNNEVKNQMTNLEIKQQIDRNNDLIKQLLDPSAFVLNNTIKQLLEENDSLQKQCTHSFVDGYCEYCYKEEEK